MMKKLTSLFVSLSLVLLSISTMAADINTDRIGFFAAARAGDNETILKYLNADGDINAMDEEGYSAFILAAYYGQDATLDVLLDRGADACTVDFRGNNAFMGVAFRGHLETAEWLLRHTDCDVNYQNYTGQTALMMAALFGHEDIIRLLLAQDADPNLVDQQGHTAASLAETQGLTNIVALLN